MGMSFASRQCNHTRACRHILLTPTVCPLSTPASSPHAGTCILFGDGCGAVLLSAAPDGQSCSLLGVDMHSDGNGQKSLHAMYSGCGGKPFQVSHRAQAWACMCTMKPVAATVTVVLSRDETCYCYCCMVLGLCEDHFGLTGWVVGYRDVYGRHHTCPVRIGVCSRRYQYTSQHRLPPLSLPAHLLPWPPKRL